MKEAETNAEQMLTQANLLNVQANCNYLYSVAEMTQKKIDAQVQVQVC